jgi:hypothetical protein
MLIPKKGGLLDPVYKLSILMEKLLMYDGHCTEYLDPSPSPMYFLDNSDWSLDHAVWHYQDIAELIVETTNKDQAEQFKEAAAAELEALQQIIGCLQKLLSRCLLSLPWQKRLC